MPDSGLHWKGIVGVGSRILKSKSIFHQKNRLPPISLPSFSFSLASLFIMNDTTEVETLEAIPLVQRNLKQALLAGALAGTAVDTALFPLGKRSKVP